MLCRLDLVSTEKITHCEMAVIWPWRNTVKIRSTEGCRVEIKSTEQSRSTEPHKHRETPWKYDLLKDVYLKKIVNNAELVLKLCCDSSTGFMEAVKGRMKPICHNILYGCS